MTDRRESANAIRVAIVGSGPAGAYAAGQLLASADSTVQVDMYDRLATPWGLVRAGVAPDHPKIKSVTRVYEKTARDPGLRFCGNVEIGTDVTHEELAAAYHAVLYAVGAPTDRRLGVPGEDLRGSHAATEFVGWYNGHPDHTDHEFDLRVRRAIVVGNGNVALDVARMLALTPEELAPTDTANHAIEALRHSAVEEIVVIGRRGPAQAAYTNPELRELAELAGADIVIDPADTELDEHSAAFIASDAADVTAKRNVDIVREMAALEPTGKPKRIVLRFLASPVEILGDERVEGLRVVRNEITPELQARPTDETEVIEAGLVLRSIGYRGTAIAGVPFDHRRGTIHNDGGRVTDPESNAPLPGVYTAGWIKRGPSGVIGTNKKCAKETVDLLLEDAAAGRLPAPGDDPASILDRLKQGGVDVVGYAGWEAIDAYERGLGEPQGRPRVKLVRRAEHLLHATAATRG
jgi:ferredoxin/flavodoxin---NADP+ reductase